MSYDYRIISSFVSEVHSALIEPPTLDYPTNPGLDDAHATRVTSTVGGEAIAKLVQCQSYTDLGGKTVTRDMDGRQAARALIGVTPANVEASMRRFFPDYKLPQPKWLEGSRRVEGNGIWVEIRSDKPLNRKQTLGYTINYVPDPDNDGMSIEAGRTYYRFIGEHGSFHQWCVQFKAAIDDLLTEDQRAVDPEVKTYDDAMDYFIDAGLSRSGWFSPQLAFANIKGVAYNATRPDELTDVEPSSGMIGTTDYVSNAFSHTDAEGRKFDGAEEEAHNDRRRAELASPAIELMRDRSERLQQERHPLLQAEREEAMDLYDEIVRHTDALENFQAGCDDLDEQARNQVVNDVSERARRIFEMIDKYALTGDEAGANEARGNASKAIWEKLIDSEASRDQINNLREYLPR